MDADRQIDGLRQREVGLERRVVGGDAVVLVRDFGEHRDLSPSPHPPDLVGSGTAGTDMEPQAGDQAIRRRFTPAADAIGRAAQHADDVGVPGHARPQPVREATRYGSTFGVVPQGASLVYVDSLGNLAMADNQGNLAARLGIGHDRPVRISRG